MMMRKKWGNSEGGKIVNCGWQGCGVLCACVCGERIMMLGGWWGVMGRREEGDYGGLWVHPCWDDVRSWCGHVVCIGGMVSICVAIIARAGGMGRVNSVLGCGCGSWWRLVRHQILSSWGLVSVLASYHICHDDFGAHGEKRLVEASKKRR